MEKDLREVATAGVFVEFCDACGNLVAQEVFFDWRDAPLPAIGDLFTCTSPRGANYRPQVIAGRVRSRYFDVQRDDEGEPRIWVRLVLDICTARQRGRDGERSKAWTLGCSLN
jgi:hypothetical protein